MKLLLGQGYRDFRKWENRQQRKLDKKHARKEKYREEKELEDKQYREGYKKALTDLVVGGKDLHEETVTNIYTTDDDFAIYEVESANPSLALKVCIYTRDPTDKILAMRYERIVHRYIDAKALLHKVEDPGSARGLIANIMSHALSLDDNQAEALFDKLVKNIETDFDDRIYNKLAFLYSNIIISFFLASMSVIRFYYLANYSTNYSPLGGFDSLTLLLFILTCASIGGTFSLSIKLKKLATIKSIRWKTYLFYGLERTFIAASAGFIFFLAVASHLVFASLTSNPGTKEYTFTILFLSVLAGFSESLVPDLLVTLERKSQQQAQDSKAPTPTPDEND